MPINNYDVIMGEDDPVISVAVPAHTDETLRRAIDVMTTDEDAQRSGCWCAGEGYWCENGGGSPVAFWQFDIQIEEAASVAPSGGGQ